MQAREYQKASKYEKLYLPHQKYQIFNDKDSELRPWVIKLPDPPELSSIVGYGLPPEHQKFTYEEEPERLKVLANVAYDQAKQKFDGSMILFMQIKNFWRILSEEQDKYVEEIAFLKRVQWHLKYGYWFFCLGKPTWLTPWHYYYLNFYYPNTLRGKRVDYRDEDRITELFEWYCYTCTEIFKNVDKDGKPIVGDSGRYEMIDTGMRTCFGSIQPKRRRRGESMKANAKAQYCTFREREFHTILQANVGGKAEKLYHDHMLPAWKKLPLWLKPIYDGVFDSESGIYLKPPKSVSNENYLDSWIMWNDSAKEGVNDGQKLHFIVDDEAAKRDRGEVSKAWAIDKKTLAQGPLIHGYSVHPSTVEEMSSGGVYYQNICEQSNFYDRDRSSGQTTSGLLRIFRPIYCGADGFIDEYGQSVIDDPTEFQLKHPAKDSVYHIYNKGSKQFWTEYFDGLSSDPTKHSTYRMEIRKSPMRYSDCWIGGAGDMGFDYVAIDQRLAELRMKQQTIKGNFIRRGDFVEWVQDDNGRFLVSNLFLGQQNKWTYGNDVWDEKKQTHVTAKRPVFTTKFTCGADPFGYGSAGSPGSKNNFSISDGGIAVVHNPDTSEEKTNRKEWESWKLVCTYNNRPQSLDMYCEDVLAVCLWYGALLCFERNKERLWEYFVDAGFGGYLLYLSNPDGTLKDKPGVYAQTGTKDEMFNCIRDYIAWRAHVENHHDFLNDAREIRTPQQLTKFDLISAVGWALYGVQNSNYGLVIERLDSGGEFSLSDFYSDKYQTSY